jgi:hypothetical protein
MYNVQHRWLTGDPSATSPAFQAPDFQVGIDRPFIVLLTSSWRQQVVISWWGRPVPAYVLHACDATINQMMARQMPIITINKMRGSKRWWSVTRPLKNNNKLQYAGKWVHPHSKKRLLALQNRFEHCLISADISNCIGSSSEYSNNMSNKK